MKNHRILSLTLTAALIGAVTVAAPAAEFSYVEKSEITGGALKRMMGLVGRFAKGAMAPVTTTHAYSGSKMATVNEKNREIWDAGAETITHVNVEDKTYAVITFAEFAQLATAMAEKMSEAFNKSKPETANANARWKASFEKNGQTRQVAGVSANGGTMKLELEGADQKSGQTGVMKMDMDMYMGKVPGWEVKQAFDKQLAAKLMTQPGPQMQAMAQAGPAAMEAMKEAGRKMSELGEMQLASVVKMYGEGMGGLPPESPSSSSSSSSSKQSSGGGDTVGQVVKDEATREAEYEAARRVGGRLGGLGGRLGGRLGGLARNKSKEQQPAPPAPEPQSAAPKAEPTPAPGPGVFLEFTTEVISYSATADSSAFAVPSGFKQVEHPMKKAWSKYADKK